MTRWWTQRRPRERGLLLGLGALACAFALYQFLLLPLLQYRTSAHGQYDTALAMLTDVEAGARGLAAVRAAAGERGDGAARTLVAAAATDLGLAITRLQPRADGELDVWLDGVSSPLLYAWVGRLQDKGIPVTRAVIQRSDGGVVSAQITFAGGAGS